jgi:hypothetical protein
MVKFVEKVNGHNYFHTEGVFGVVQKSTIPSKLIL